MSRIVFGLDIDKHLQDVRDTVNEFLSIVLMCGHWPLELNPRPASFKTLNKYMELKFRMVDMEMWKEWLEKEFPNIFDFDN
jgi:hypothetical protein